MASSRLTVAMSDNQSPFVQWFAQCLQKRSLTMSTVKAFTSIPRTRLMRFSRGAELPAPEELRSLEAFLGEMPAEVKAWITSEIQTDSIIDARILNPFAKRLRTERQRIGLTKASCAEFLGIRPGRLALLENGDELPNHAELTVFCSIFGPLTSLEEVELKKEEDLRYAEAHPDLTPFGRLIRRARESRGLSMAAVSRMLVPGTMSSRIASDIEHSFVRPTHDVLRKLAGILTDDGKIPNEWYAALRETHQRHEYSMPPLGQELQKLRRERIGTRLKAAELTGLTQRQIQDIEFGDVPVSDKELDFIAHALGFDSIPEHWFELRQASGQTLALIPRTVSGHSPFGVLLREYRRKKNLTQKALCLALDARSTYICEIERGTIALTLDDLNKLAHCVGLSEAPPEWVEALIEGGQLKQGG